MIKQIVNSKLALVVLAFWLLCQNMYAHPSEPATCVAPLLESVCNDYELPLDTLTKEEQRRIEETKRREELEQQKETRESELAAEKGMERFVRENESLTIYQNSTKKEQRQKISTNDEKAVVFGIRAGANLASWPGIQLYLQSSYHLYYFLLQAKV